LSTAIVGRGIGGLTRVSTTDDAVVAFLIMCEAKSKGIAAARQGVSNTWWCDQKVVAAVEMMINQ
jgi:hypothetical protein